MWLFPYHQFDVETLHPISDLVQILSAYVELQLGPDQDGSEEDTAEFEGRVDEAGFWLRPLTYNDRKYRPVIHGRFLQAGPGTVVEITIRLNWFAMTFPVVYVIGFGILLFVFMVNPGPLPGPPLKALAMLVGGGCLPPLLMWTFVLIGFRMEVRPNKELLIKLLRDSPRVGHDYET